MQTSESLKRNWGGLLLMIANESPDVSSACRPQISLIWTAADTNIHIYRSIYRYMCVYIYMYMGVCRLAQQPSERSHINQDVYWSLRLHSYIQWWIAVVVCDDLKGEEADDCLHRWICMSDQRGPVTEQPPVTNSVDLVRITALFKWYHEKFVTLFNIMLHLV